MICKTGSRISTKMLIKVVIKSITTPSICPITEIISMRSRVGQYGTDL